jgi:hypothetical protein
MFIVRNKEIFDINRDCYEINTRHNMDLNMNQVNLTKYGNGIIHMAVWIYNALPNKLKINSNDINKFKSNSKEYLYLNTFYTLGEFL